MIAADLAPLALLLSVAVNAGYAPSRGFCPPGAQDGHLIRSATGGVNPDEAAYVSKRYQSATTSLQAFLTKLNAGFPTLAANQYPMLALVDGGGGLRGWTISAGIHKAFDGEEPDAANYSTSGLYQAFTYQAGLSGTAIEVYSYVQNNWPLTSTLLNSLWINAFGNNIAMNPPAATPVIGGDVATKQATGFTTSITDLWGRILSYGAFLGPNPGQSSTISGFASLPGITSFTRPYPIVTAIGLEDLSNGCGLPPKNATQYEFTMHEFGSWEAGVSNFVQSKYLGTSFNNARPFLNVCTTGYDNVGWVAGVSSSTFNQPCANQANTLGAIFNAVDLTYFSSLFRTFLGTAQQSNYATLPNPFNGLASAPKVNSEALLTLVDGGETIQVSPIWPFLYRPEVDVLVVSDSGADSPTNYGHPVGSLPSGQQIYHVYQQALVNGISYRMPYIPPPATFMAKNLNKNPMTFFGCTLNASSPAVFIIYMPNRPVVFNSAILASVTQYNESTTLGMIANGEAIATNNGDPQFATCMACGLMKRAAAKAGKALPAACKACFTKYCN